MTPSPRRPSRPARATLPTILIALLTVSLLSAPIATTARQATPISGGDPAGLLWQTEVPGLERDSSLFWRPEAGPLIAGDIVVTYTDRLRGYDLGTGALRWESATAVAPAPRPVVVGDLLIVTVPGQVEAPMPDPEAPDFWVAAVVGIDAATGSVRWATAIDEQADQPVIANGTVIVTAGLSMLAFDAATGARVWEQDLSFTSTVLLGADDASGTLVGATSERIGTGFRSRLVAFRLADGEPLWDREVLPPTGTPVPGGPWELISTRPALGDGLVTFERLRREETTAERVAVGIDVETGEDRWTVPIDLDTLGIGAAGPTIADGTVFVTGGSGVRALDTGTGAERWRMDTEVSNLIFSPVTVARGVAYAGGPGEQLSAMDAANGALLWRATTLDGILAPVAIGSDVVVLPVSGGLRAVTASPDGVLIDATGLPACDVAPRPPLQDRPGPPGSAILPFTGTPAATLATPAPDAHPLTPPDRDPTTLPPTPADDVTLAELENAVTLLASCGRSNPDYREDEPAGYFLTPDRFAALFSDDFLRRDWVAGVVQRLGYALLPSGIAIPGEIISTHVLPDGRVAVVTIGHQFPTKGIFVFADRDGEWLVDEYFSVPFDSLAHIASS